VRLNNVANQERGSLFPAMQLTLEQKESFAALCHPLLTRSLLSKVGKMAARGSRRLRTTTKCAWNSRITKNSTH